MPKMRKTQRTEAGIQYLNGFLNRLDQNSPMYTAMQRLIDLKRQRAEDLENHLGYYNEKQYLDDYKTALEEILNSGNEDAVPSQVIEGFRMQAEAIENGWGAEELEIFAFLGETKANLDNHKLILEHDINNNLREEFEDLYNEIRHADVISRRQKLKYVEQVVNFAKANKSKAGMYGESRMVKLDNYADEVLGDFTDSYSMKGQSKENQLGGIMQDLDTVDGTFQHSSENFRELRKRLEELDALAKKYPGEMTREQFDEYLKKVEEVQAAADRYLKGKNDEFRNYKNSHGGRLPEIKEITKKRMSFAMGLEERLALHLEHSTPARFRMDVSADDTEYSMALMARRMREEDRYRRDNQPKEAIDANHAFLKSVYRSLYIESMRSKVLGPAGMNAAGLELSMDPSKISEGAESLAQKYKALGLEKNLLENINHKIAIGETEFGRDFILDEIGYGMLSLRNNKNEEIAEMKDSVLKGFGYEDRKEADPDDPDEKLGFGRYLDYPDRDDDTGISKLEEIEKELGVSAGKEKVIPAENEFVINDQVTGNGIGLGNINRVNAVNEQFLSAISDGKLSEEQLRENVSTYLMNVYKVGWGANRQEENPGRRNSLKQREQEKEALMNSAVKTLVGTMKLSDLTGKDLKEFLQASTENGLVGEMVKNANAATDAVLIRKRRYEEEFEKVDSIYNRLSASYANMKEGDLKQFFKGMIDDLQKLKDMLNEVIENPNRPFDSKSYLETRDGVSEHLRMLENNRYMLEFADELDGHVFAHDVHSLDNALDIEEIQNGPNYQKHSEMNEELRRIDGMLYEANRNFLETGVYPGNRIKQELNAFYKKINQLHDECSKAKALTDSSRISVYLSSPVEKTGKILAKAALDPEFDEESRQRTKEYLDQIQQERDMLRLEQEEKDFLNDKRVINLTTDTIIKPEDKPGDTLKVMMAKEESLRENAIKTYLADEPKQDELFNKIIASSCRSLYMEMLKSRYEDEEKLGNMSEQELAKNESAFRKAISFGFKDKMNMVEFANLMNQGDFGKYFKDALKEKLSKSKKLTHEDIKKARDVALYMDYKEAMPDYKLDEKTGKYVSEKESNFVKADNIRILALALGSHVLDGIQNIKFPIKEEEKKLQRDLQVVTDYSKPEAQKAPKPGNPVK